LRELVASDPLPDYGVSMDAGQVLFHRREGKPPELVKPPAPVPVVTAVEPEAKKRGIFISTSAFERLHEIAPGWDKYMLERLYCEWAAGIEPAHNEDSRFFGWVKSYTKNKAAS
jgi:hypothetical protein